MGINFFKSKICLHNEVKSWIIFLFFHYSNSRSDESKRKKYHNHHHHTLSKSSCNWWNCQYFSGYECVFPTIVFQIFFITILFFFILFHQNETIGKKIPRSYCWLWWWWWWTTKKWVNTRKKNHSSRRSFFLK